MAEWWNIEDVLNGRDCYPFAVVADYGGPRPAVDLAKDEDMARNAAQVVLGRWGVQRVAVVDASTPEARLVVEVVAGEPPSCNPTS